MQFHDVQVAALVPTLSLTPVGLRSGSVASEPSVAADEQDRHRQSAIDLRRSRGFVEVGHARLGHRRDVRQRIGELDIETPDRRVVEVTEKVVASSPFATVVHFSKRDRHVHPKVLVVSPLGFPLGAAMQLRFATPVTGEMIASKHSSIAARP